MSDHLCELNDRLLRQSEELEALQRSSKVGREGGREGVQTYWLVSHTGKEEREIVVCPAPVIVMLFDCIPDKILLCCSVDQCYSTTVGGTTVRKCLQKVDLTVSECHEPLPLLRGLFPLDMYERAYV